MKTFKSNNIFALTSMLHCSIIKYECLRNRLIILENLENCFGKKNCPIYRLRSRNLKIPSLPNNNFLVEGHTRKLKQVFYLRNKKFLDFGVGETFDCVCVFLT